jgi:hypothetical protein
MRTKRVEVLREDLDVGEPVLANLLVVTIYSWDVMIRTDRNTNPIVDSPHDSAILRVRHIIFIKAMYFSLNFNQCCVDTVKAKFRTLIEKRTVLKFPAL